MREYIEKYLESYLLTHAPRTTLRVQYQLKYFEKYVRRRKVYSIYQLETKHVLGWSQKLGESISKSTLPSYLFALKGFCEWLYKEDYVPFSLWPSGFQIKQAKHLPKVVPSVRELAEHLDNVPQNIQFPYRNRAILELAYSTALRRSEIESLNIDQFQGDWLEVIGKGNKARRVPLGGKTKQALVRYIKSERRTLLEKYGNNDRALFLGQRGKRLGGGSLNAIVHKTKPDQPAGKNRRYTLHSFRHACATHMLENGANIRILQKLLGHEKLSSTEVYTDVSPTSLKEKLRGCHSRG